ncbi:MAG: HPF/RaiA family ribosome-associated protein [Polyangiales bacterium]
MAGIAVAYCSGMNRTNITFRNVEPSPALRARIEEEAAKLPKEVVSCNAVVTAGKNEQSLRLEAHVPHETVVFEEKGPNVYAIVGSTFGGLTRGVREHFARQADRRA